MDETIINGIIEVSQEVVGQLQYDIGVKGDTGDSGVYHAGQLNVIENTSTLKKSVSGSVILIDDVSPVTHEMGVRVRGKNLVDDTKRLFTGGAIFFGFTKSIIPIKLSKGTYTFSVVTADSTTTNLYIKNSDNTKTLFIAYSRNTLTFTLSETQDILLSVYKSGYTSTDDVVTAQLEIGTTATAYTPYVPDLTAVKVRKQGKNLIPFPYRELKLGTFTYNGVIFTVYEDGSILINGTAISNTTRYLYRNETDLLGLKSGITISGSKNASDNTQQGNVYFICNYYDSAGKMQSGIQASIAVSGKMTITDDWKGLGIYLHIPKGETLNNLLIKPQLEIGTTATEYEPYSAPIEYTPTADGTVNGVTSLYPSTTLMTDTGGVLIDCEYYKDIDVSDVIERTVTAYTNPKIKIIGDYAFHSCSALTSVDFPIATSIGNRAFNSCSALTSVDFPIATNIDMYAFYNCTSLTSVDFPAATNIGDYAFSNCTSLTSVDFPIATRIGNGAFYNCTSLTSVDFLIATSIGDSAFYNCSALTSVDFPIATSIGNRAFHSCSALTSADFPAAKSISEYAFYNCTSLTSVDFPIATRIGNSAFHSCSALTSVDFPIATNIGDYAFSNCTSLTSVDFPAATSIKNNVFRNCTSLTALILRNSTICTLSNKNAFDGCTHITGTGGYIYVPSSLINRYKRATNWVTYASKFRALEDYTVDGTTTGALDESKVNV